MIADGGLFVFVVTYVQFLLQSRFSDSIEHQNEPVRYICHTNFAISIFVVQINQTDAYFQFNGLANLAECHQRNNNRETLFDSQDIIAELR